MGEDFVGRSSTGVATANKNLGTASIPWGTLRANAIIVGGAALDTSQVSAPPFRVVSGKVRTTSNQPQYLTPAGAAASFTISAATTSLVYSVAGSSFTLSSDIVTGSLSLAPSSNNTALVNDTDAADQESTRTWGEIDGERDITIDSAGSEITALIGTYQAFGVNDGTTDEYFWAYIESATKLTKVYRGFYYNSSLNPVNRLKFANNDTITLLKAHYVFLENDLATVDTTTRAPFVQFSTPGSPATDDYWYDLDNQLWKRYNGSSFDTVNRAYIGMVVCDQTNCIAARCVPFDKRHKSDNAIELRKDSATVVEARSAMNKLIVDGSELYYDTAFPSWDITTNLATSVDMYNSSEQASTMYYFYVTEEGDTKISDISPYWRPDMWGYYHPHNTWRCVGSAFNDSSSDLEDPADMMGVQGRDRKTERMNLTGPILVGTRIDGLQRVSKPKVLRAISITLGDSGSSGTTTVQVNRKSLGPSGTGTVTASLASNSNALDSAITVLDSGLKFLQGDVFDVDITAIGSGAEDLTVELEFEQSN